MISSSVKAHKIQAGLTSVPGVKNMIAVASGKGGVGKSTTAVNLALALSANSARVGILDADIYGPSIPLMLGVHEKPVSVDGKMWQPIHKFGLQMMSMGLLVEQDSAMIWRGPMVTKAVQQLLVSTQWEDLDYLIVDLPPGTGDIHLTMAQKMPIAGALIVTTPQDIALADALRALKMFEKVHIPILGVVENMSTHICSACGHAEAIFGEKGAQVFAKASGVPLLAQLPLDKQIRAALDHGIPTVMAEPDSTVTQQYSLLAERVSAELALQPPSFVDKLPRVVVR